MTTDPRRRGPAEPHPTLNVLNRLVGTWTVSGSAISGTARYAWMDGGYFLVAHTDLRRGGRRITGVEYIGHDPVRGELTSHSFDSTGALHRYRYRLDPPTMTIEPEQAGEHARYLGVFDADGTTHSGRWQWPGGTCPATHTRIG